MALYKMVYVDEGNVVRQTKVMDLADREDREHELLRRWKKRKRDRLWAHRKRKWESKYYICGLSMRMLLLGLMLSAYINVQNDISMRLGHISTLERQVTDLKKDNEAKQKRLAIRDDITSIENKARKRYGMDYAKRDQVVYYSLAARDFMNQYHEVK